MLEPSSTRPLILQLQYNVNLRELAFGLLPIIASARPRDKEKYIPLYRRLGQFWFPLPLLQRTNCILPLRLAMLP